MDTSPLLQQLLQEQKTLRQDLFLKPSRQPPAWKDLEPPPCDPRGKDILLQLFSRTPAGQLEALKLEVDVLRRARRRTPELFHRPFGTARWITPVLHRNTVVHLLDSGPVKVGPWTPAEKETLAKTCGLSVKQLPPELDDITAFPADLLPLLHQQQQRLALAMSLLMDPAPTPATPEAPAPDTPATGDPAAAGLQLDLLHPGFADHLAHLFQILQHELSALDPHPGLSRMNLAVQRGRHLVDNLQRINQRRTLHQEALSVHALLQKWTALLQQETRTRFDLKLDASPDRLFVNPHSLHHLLYTLLAGVTDGLHSQGSLIHIRTRNSTLDGRPALHLVIRDNDGMATFAGVSPAWDEEVIAEQNEASEEYADWVSLAERIDARLRIQRENDIITRIELLLPLHTDAALETESPASSASQVWMVLENASEAKQLTHMLREYGTAVHWLHSGGELRQHYQTASAPPDLVLLEYLLSDSRGTALRSWLYEQDPDLPVILMSGFAATHPGIATASSLPSTLYLQKPFDTQTLFDMLRMTLENRQTLS